MSRRSRYLLVAGLVVATLLVGLSWQWVKVWLPK